VGAVSGKEIARKVGRPRIDVEKYFAKIQVYLLLGYSLHKSCLYAEVPYRQLKDYYDEHEDFRNKVERTRDYPNVRARMTLIFAIEQGDVKSAIEWLEAMEKDDFAKRTEVKDVTETDSEELTLLREILDKHERTGKPVPAKQQTN
jgi:hypothetical protein